ncbi:MAG: sigma-70 family RNA polymerase sigma factor [Verrucomicrobiales bacterium]|nr:sigma-70 family RNA polymerase sigma factor [Verrucomicrobiales bacterium]
MTPSTRETRWSLVTRAQGDTPAAHLALSELCEIYYAPVLAYIRSWAGPDETEDLTHAFFERILAGDSLKGASQQRGRFRSYLLGAVKHFLCENRAKEHRLKRGSHLPHLEIKEEIAPDHAALPPDAEFDRAWACTLLDRALRLLAEEMNQSGKDLLFQELHPWLTGAAGYGDQTAVAEKLGLGETSVRVQVHRLRKRFREIIEAEVAQTLDSGTDPAAELRHLLSVC